VTYLDHAGTTLYTDQQVVSTMKDLTANVYGNPHSRSDCSQRTTELVELVRARLALSLYNSASYPLWDRNGVAVPTYLKHTNPK